MLKHISTLCLLCNVLEKGYGEGDMNRRLGAIYRRYYEGTNNRLRSFAGGRWASYCRPTWIAILLTELCNARCVHCDIWKNRGKEDSPTLSQWKALLSDLRKWLGPVHVLFTGGEALLKPFAIDVVRHASSMGLYVEHLTHGYWADQSKIEELALAGAGCITVSLDAVGEVHSKIRGRENFYERTSRTVETLKRVRRERDLGYTIRLKTVIMDQNVDHACNVAHYARQGGMEVLYQPIEQNYNTSEDLMWYKTSENWPKDSQKAVTTVERLIQLKHEGYPISNSYAQLEVMIPYFRDPDALQLATQSHMAHERRFSCAALGMLQVQANGDVRTCARQPPVGNIRAERIRAIWANRPHWWEAGCCFERYGGDHRKKDDAAMALK